MILTTCVCIAVLTQTYDFNGVGHSRRSRSRNAGPACAITSELRNMSERTSYYYSKEVGFQRYICIYTLGEKKYCN